jgi:hypothetical protein
MLIKRPKKKKRAGPIRLFYNIIGFKHNFIKAIFETDIRDPTTYINFPFFAFLKQMGFD